MLACVGTGVPAESCTNSAMSKAPRASSLSRVSYRASSDTLKLLLEKPLLVLYSVQGTLILPGQQVSKRPSPIASTLETS